jgi:4-aminobutyrate aminotransferase-like enzyme
MEMPEVLAVIDYGDAIYSQTINDLAVTCAYGIMDQNDPLSAALAVVRGFDQGRKLSEEELLYLYDCIAMRLVITVTKSALNKIKEPDNIYLQVSEKPAWEVLKKWKEISADFAYYSFRNACGYTAHPDEEKFTAWASEVNIGLDQLFPTKNTQECVGIDLSVSSKWLGHLSEFANFELFDFKINQLQKKYPDAIIGGGYIEPRLVYNTEAYQKNGNEKKESRTIHLGIDFWLPAGTPVHALLKGEVVLAENDAGDKEYGGLIILKHDVKELTFYSLYGHLSVASATSRVMGEIIEAGELIGDLGNYPENGNWPPHLHFELMLSMLDYQKDFPGVAYHSEIETWKSICPDPNLLFKLASLRQPVHPDNIALRDFRKTHLGKGMSLSYQQPLQMVRGMGAYLIDQFGAAYLDTVNNVAHVGHEHPFVVKAGQDQMALLNTNTRYLHENINLLAEELLDTFPPELSVVHLVNSGSEANELALRMAKVVTGNKDVLASEMGYHGNTNACIEISSYKFDGKGGSGCPEHTQIFPLPDRFRGQHRGENTGNAYAEEVEKTISVLKRKGRAPAAFIIEPIISCGGQIELPQGFLPKAYAHTRNAGGLCISDEVQVGCGRMGSAFWGFQLHNVIPDIVTIGKPLGNGHPVAAVVCSKEVADKFANGMEYFNTFGGNPVSCAIATEVLKTVKREHLQTNALEVGNYLKAELKELAKTFPVLKDIRGQGLFLGIELTDEQLNPLPEQTQYLTNRMKDKGILMSIDGPDHNVLKIKPPMVFSKDNAIELIDTLTSVLNENYMKTK